MYTEHTILKPYLLMSSIIYSKNHKAKVDLLTLC